MTLEQILKIRRSGFNEDIGIEFTNLENFCCEGRIKIEARHLNASGGVHGGCIFTLMDSVCGIAAFSSSNYVTTSSSNVLFLNQAMNTQYIRTIAKPIKLGKSLKIYEAEVFDDADKLISRANFTFFVLGELTTESP